jgi:hypothetical protein
MSGENHEPLDEGDLAEEGGPLDEDGHSDEMDLHEGEGEGEGEDVSSDDDVSELGADMQEGLYMFDEEEEPYFSLT